MYSRVCCSLLTMIGLSSCKLENMQGSWFFKAFLIAYMTISQVIAATPLEIHHTHSEELCHDVSGLEYHTHHHHHHPHPHNERQDQGNGHDPQSPHPHTHIIVLGGDTLPPSLPSLDLSIPSQAPCYRLPASQTHRGAPYFELLKPPQ